jgi:hypothetical protein
MNNVIMRSIPVTTEYHPLVVQPLVGSVTISTPPDNAANVEFLGDDGNAVPWVPGEWHEFRSIDLSSIYVRGQAGDLVSLVGGTW